jgi:hypothetical protein
MVTIEHSFLIDSALLIERARKTSFGTPLLAHGGKDSTLVFACLPDVFHLYRGLGMKAGAPLSCHTLPLSVECLPTGGDTGSIANQPPDRRCQGFAALGDVRTAQPGQIFSLSPVLHKSLSKSGSLESVEPCEHGFVA